MSALPYCAYFSLNEILNSCGFIICVTIIICITCVYCMNSVFFIILVLSIFCITCILCIIIEMILKSPCQFRLQKTPQYFGCSALFRA